MKKDLNKICIGSANFGTKYGINQSKVSEKELKKIFNFINKKKINFIDTAFSYKDSEKKIGKYKKSKINIITKIPKFPNKNINLHKWIKKLIDNSLKNLKTNKLYAILFHNPEDLYDKKRSSIVLKYLILLQKKKIIKKIGISVYSIHEMKRCFSRHNFQLVQFPINVIDQRISKNNFLKILKKRNVELHGRSIFLQGLLLKDPEKNMKRLKYLQKPLKIFEKITEKKKISKLEYCIKYAFSNDVVDKFVIGINDYNQLSQITKVIENIKKNYFSIKLINVKKKFILNPKNW